MKKRVSTTVVLLLLFVAPALTRAQSPPTAAGGGKIGLLNIQQAIAMTGEGKEALSALDKKYQPKKTELQRLQQEISSLDDQLQRGQNTLSEDEIVRLTRERDEKQKILKRSQEDAQSEFTLDNQDIGRRIGQKMVRVINEYATQNGYDLVLDPAAAQMPVYFASKQVDILDEIVKRYDAANPVSASATTPATPATRSAPRSAVTTPAATKPKP